MMRKTSPMLSNAKIVKQSLKWILGLCLFALVCSNIIYFAVNVKQETRTLAKLNHVVVEKATGTASILLRGKGKSLQSSSTSSRSEDEHGEAAVTLAPPSMAAWEDVVSKLAQREAKMIKAKEEVEEATADADVKTESLSSAAVELTFLCMDADSKNCAERSVYAPIAKSERAWLVYFDSNLN